MILVHRLLIALTLAFALGTASAWSQAPAPTPFTPEKAAPAPTPAPTAKQQAAPAPAPATAPAQTKAVPAKEPSKNTLQLPSAKTAAPALKAAPPAPVAAPRQPVEPRAIPAFVPPGPPPLDETSLHKPVLAVLKAAQAMGAEEDSARWVDTGACWVWIGMKRVQAWSRYRFSYEGGCGQGRAEGAGKLKIESQNAQGKWEPETEFETIWKSGVPLSDAKAGTSTGGNLLIGLADRTVLSWMGSSMNEEAEVFAVGRADDQGRVTPCASQSLLAVAQSSDIGGDRFKHLLRRAVSVVGAQCQDNMRTLWLVSLVPSEGLVLSSRQGAVNAQPIKAQAEIREGVIYAYSQRFATPPALLPQTSSVPGAQMLSWTPPIEELDHQLLLVFALPVFLLILLLVAMRIAYASTRNVVAPAPKIKAKPAPLPANSAKRR